MLLLVLVFYFKGTSNRVFFISYKTQKVMVNANFERFFKISLKKLLTMTAILSLSGTRASSTKVVDLGILDHWF